MQEPPHGPCPTPQPFGWGVDCRLSESALVPGPVDGCNACNGCNLVHLDFLEPSCFPLVTCEVTYNESPSVMPIANYVSFTLRVARGLSRTFLRSLCVSTRESLRALLNANHRNGSSTARPSIDATCGRFQLLGCTFPAMILKILKRRARTQLLPSPNQCTLIFVSPWP